MERFSLPETALPASSQMLFVAVSTSAWDGRANPNPQSLSPVKQTSTEFPEILSQFCPAGSVHLCCDPAASSVFRCNPRSLITGARVDPIGKNGDVCAGEVGGKWNYL